MTGMRADAAAFLREKPLAMWVGAAVGLVACSLGAGVMLPWKRWEQYLLDGHSFQASIWTWLVCVFFLFVAGNILFLVWSRISPKTVPEAAMAFSIFWGLAVSAAVVDSVFYLFTDTGGQVRALLAALSGGILGWILGIYVTPQDNSETQRFTKIAATVTAALSGYGVKSVQDWLGDSAHAQYRPFVYLGLMSTALSLATVYNTRAYGSNVVTITFPDAFADTRNKGVVKVAVGKVVQFVASVVGPADTSVTWEVIGAAGSVDRVTGVFTPAAAGECKVVARSMGDPRLSDVVEVVVG